MLKKWKKGALLAPALLAAALAFAACKNIEDGGEIQPPAPEQGASGGSANQDDGNGGGGGNPSGEEGENPVPDLEYVYEITSVSMPNENISPKRVSEILGELFFDYTMTHSSTGAGYPQSNVSYGNLPEEIKREIKFKETAENGGVERAREYEFPEDQKEVPFEIWHGGKSLFATTLKNGNYNRAVLTKKIIALLKEIIGEVEYDAISAGVAAGNLTLTAEKIKALGDFFPALENDAEAGKEAKDAENDATILQNKEAFVAQAEGVIEVRFGPEYPDWYEEYPFLFDEETAEKKYVVTYNTNVVFSGEFNLDEISLPDNNGKGTFADGAVLKGEEIRFDKLNTIRGVSLPELQFNNVTSDFYVVEKGFLSYKLYKDYSDELSKLKIKGDFPYTVVNGAKDKDGNLINDYTLFEEDGNTVKNSGDDTIKSLDINVLIQMYEQLGIKKFVNMIISGTPTEKTEVDWILTNIVFENDMNNLEQTQGGDLVGIVYFKGKPYNIDLSNLNSGQRVIGLLKLDKLEGVSYDNFRICIDTYSGVLDVRGVNKNTIESYNNGILFNEGYSHAIYFNEYYNYLKDDQEKINKLCDKFSNNQSRRFINVYLGADRVHGQSYRENNPLSIIGAKNPRFLKEFEDFGNYFENNYKLKFETTAKETYNEDEFNALSDFDRTNLENSPYANPDEIAQTNKRHFCIKAKSVV